MKRITLLFLLLLQIALVRAQVPVDPFISGGYNRCRGNWLDAGFRCYRLADDGQAIMMFSGPAAGCEFSLGRHEQVYVPYLGWQGQLLMLGYGARFEYACSSEQQVPGFSVEAGWSLFEFLRVTGGYRAVFDRRDPMQMQGLRFSLILAWRPGLFADDDQ